MKYICLSLFCLSFVLRSYAQDTAHKDLTSLSKEFQQLFWENGWMMQAPMSLGGLYFTNEYDPFDGHRKGDALMFWRIKDTVHWSREEEKYQSLNHFIVGNDRIQDSIAYKVLGVYDKRTGKQIVDVYRFWHIDYFKQAIFVTPEVRGEFVGGMQKLKYSLATYLNIAISDNIGKEYKFVVYFSGAEPYRFLTVISENKDMKNILSHFFEETGVRHNPGVRYGRPTYTRYIFDVINTDMGFVIDDVEQSHSFFCYTDLNFVYFIEPLQGHEERPEKELTFFFDEKWNKEEFFNSADIIALEDQVGSPYLSEALKDFFRSHPKPFSAIYRVRIEER